VGIRESEALRGGRRRDHGLLRKGWGFFRDGGGRVGFFLDRCMMNGRAFVLFNFGVS
jgi:hypothetical protein